MSLQDTVFDLQFEIEEYIKIAGGDPNADHKTIKKYHEIIERLWAYEKWFDDNAGVLASHNIGGYSFQPDEETR